MRIALWGLLVFVFALGTFALSKRTGFWLNESKRGEYVRLDHAYTADVYDDHGINKTNGYKLSLWCFYGEKMVIVLSRFDNDNLDIANKSIVFKNERGRDLRIEGFSEISYSDKTVAFDIMNMHRFAKFYNDKALIIEYKNNDGKDKSLFFVTKGILDTSAYQSCKWS